MRPQDDAAFEMRRSEHLTDTTTEVVPELPVCPDMTMEVVLERPVCHVMNITELPARFVSAREDVLSSSVSLPPLRWSSNPPAPLSWSSATPW